ncbi:MAG: class I SAM-dependent methyltransferase [Bdellovibrio sp.]|nr:class I SAM-dependent methyltransferase [Bdellovibrio sp.]
MNQNDEARTILRYVDHEDFVLFFKPNGLRMHQVDDGQFGFIEAVSQQLDKKLFIVHRLDKETSGLVMAAKTKVAAAALAELFEKHLVKKTYYFLTDKNVAETSFLVKTHIEKVQNQFVNNLGLTANSETELNFVKTVGAFYLWQAKPVSGRSHQIRLHAEHSGISLLGDLDHNGSPWFRLALFATDLEFTLNSVHHRLSEPIPEHFEKLDSSELKSLFLDAQYNLNKIFHTQPTESYRLVQNDRHKIRADILGTYLWVYDYSDKGLSDFDISKLQEFANEKNLHLIVRHMLDRGQGVGGLEKSTLLNQPEASSWTADEEGVHYEFRTDSGFSPGLFLDQRENRKWVSSVTKGKTVLNLFSYTSGFSVVAGLAAATKVTSVDASKKFLEWSKQNFRLNNLKPENSEFFAQDCLVFLNGSKKRNRKWDLIICDPPSFGRSQDSVWKIERNIFELAELMWNCLEKNGQILFTCNFEKWTRKELVANFTKKLPHGSYKIERMPLLSLDFGETDEIKSLMKGFVLIRTK